MEWLGFQEVKIVLLRFALGNVSLGFPVHVNRTKGEGHTDQGIPYPLITKSIILKT